MPKAERKDDVLLPRKPIALDSLKGVRSEIARIYRLTLKGTVPPEEATKLVYVLKEIRCCIEAEVLDGVQQRLEALSVAVGGRRGR